MGESVICMVCGKSFKYLIWKHLKQHNLTTEQYKNKYPDAKFVSEISLEKMKKFQQNHNPMKGRKNPTRTLFNKLQTGEKHPNYGKPLSEEVKKKILFLCAIVVMLKQVIGIEIIGPKLLVKK